jgi:HPt (histidine-containing phosphotransfer) domain-containing protein
VSKFIYTEFNASVSKLMTSVFDALASYDSCGVTRDIHNIYGQKARATEYPSVAGCMLLDNTHRA